jgi:hypothetical protein
LGSVVLTVGLTYAGFHQGHLLNDHTVSFAEISKSMNTWFMLRSGVFALLLVGNLAFFINFLRVACPICSKCAPVAQFNTPPALKATVEGHA